jgi:hypothetical protein
MYSKERMRNDEKERKGDLAVFVCPILGKRIIDECIEVKRERERKKWRVLQGQEHQHNKTKVD